MSYHPVMGVLIFVVAVVVAFFLGRLVVKKVSAHIEERKPFIGDAGAPDAPWLNEEEAKH